MMDQTEKVPCNLVPRLLPNFSSHTVQKMGRKPGRFDYVCIDVLCVVPCMLGMGNRIIAHARHLIAFNCARDRVTLMTVTAIDVTQYDSMEFSLNNVSPESDCYNFFTDLFQ